MIGVYIALVLVSLLVVGLIVALAWVNSARCHWKTHDAKLERQLAFDEALLDQLRGPRRSPDCDDLQRGGRR